MVTTTSQARPAAQRSAFQAAELMFKPREPRLAVAHQVGARDCPHCGAIYPVAPRRSRLRQPNRIEHDWHCAACGHDWMTTITFPGPPLVPGLGHRFAVGNSVRLVGKQHSRSAAPGAYQVVHLRPESGGEFHYGIKHAMESHSRVAREGELELLG
jgi:hypothetical protein